MSDLSIEQITQWARTVKPGEYRVGTPIPRELVEMARLAFEAGRQSTSKDLLLPLLASLTLSDNLGDVGDDVYHVMKKLGIKYEDSGDWQSEVSFALHLLGVKTLYGTTLGGETP